MGRLQNRVAIVTGGAHGIGKAIALAFAREGAAVAIADLNLEQAQAVAENARSAGGDAVSLATDVLSSDAVAGLVDAVLAKWGTIDVLVNAAGGFQKFAPITEITEEEWDRIVALNLKSAFLCARAVVPTMVARGRGRIVSIASQAGVAPNPQRLPTSPTAPPRQASSASPSFSLETSAPTASPSMPSPPAPPPPAAFAASAIPKASPGSPP